MTDKEQKVIDLAKDYRVAAINADRAFAANGRRGASDAAVNAVNAFRVRAKWLHDSLMQAVDDLIEDAS